MTRGGAPPDAADQHPGPERDHPEGHGVPERLGHRRARGTRTSRARRTRGSRSATRPCGNSGIQQAVRSTSARPRGDSASSLCASSAPRADVEREPEAAAPVGEALAQQLGELLAVALAPRRRGTGAAARSVRRRRAPPGAPRSTASHDDRAPATAGPRSRSTAARTTSRAAPRAARSCPHRPGGQAAQPGLGHAPLRR